MKNLFLLFCLLLAFPANATLRGSAPQTATGTFTPAVTASSTAGTPAYTTAVGTYVTNGKLIYAQFNLVLSGWTGTPSGNVSITGLPFTSGSTSNDNGGCMITRYSVSGLASLNYGLTGVISPSTTAVLLYQEGNASEVQLTAAQAGTTPTFIGFCIYHQ